jgi:hypothetical protein
VKLNSTQSQRFSLLKCGMRSYAKKTHCEMPCNMLINKVVKLIETSGSRWPRLAPGMLQGLQTVRRRGVSTGM